MGKRSQYGDIFATSIDFSGTYLVARRVVCLFNPTTNCAHLTTNNTNDTKSLTTNHAAKHKSNQSTHNTAHSRPAHLKYLAYSGLYGPSSPVHASVPVLAERVLNNYEYLEKWEDVATPIIRNFLARLVYEGSFSFADRVNE